MALTPRLDLRQSQSLVMTPQLQQAIKLLQYSNAELMDYVEGELERNPVLEREDGEGSALAEAVAADNLSAYEQATQNETGPVNEADGFDSEPDGPDLMDQASAETLPSEGENPIDSDYDNNWGSADVAETDFGPSLGSGELSLGSYGGTGGRSDFEDDEFGIEQTLGSSKSLREHLLDQVGVDISEPRARLIAAQLVDQLDDTGYLSSDLDEVADGLGCPLDEVEAVLERLQAMDPAGVFARSLGECLALQLKDRNRFDPAMQALLDNLELLAKRELPKLMKLCGVDAEDMAEMVEEIRSLDPKPGLAFDPAVEDAVTPDVLMRAAPDGSWLIELNPDSLPRVLINNAYYARVGKQARAKGDKEYISECMQTANWLVKALHQRATTILKVATEIARQQDGFFQFGIQHLKPLVLRDIADAISMHESTVSRVTSNKFVSTPRGVYELKYFFTSSISSSVGGDALSAEAVRHKIKRLIDEEPVKKVLSDDKIVDILKGEGVDIARRTVAKYREAMRIPSSVQRRREKAMGL